jgi:L-ectoine synthase
MKVTTIKQIENTERDVAFEQGRSLRAVLKSDGMGFSVHKTLIRKGTVGNWHYKHHLETCYCISGSGVLTNCATKEKHNITPDTIYSLDQNDDHIFEAMTDVVLISIFNPPVSGSEIHDSEGSYSPNMEQLDFARAIVSAVYASDNKYEATETVNELLTKKTI